MTDVRDMTRVALVGILLLVLGPLLATLEVAPAMVGFLLYAAGGFLGLIAAIGGLVSLVRGRGGRALALAAAPAAIFVASFATGMGPPPVNDITTNVDDPPAFTNAPTIPANAGRDFAYRDDLKAIVREAYPDLKPLAIRETPSAVYDGAIEIARAQPGWEITREDLESLTFEGVATTRLFKFRDDFVVRVKADGEGSLVDMRSKSRDGIGDRGTNAARIRAFFAEIAG
jgi:uncharacterized protein (DUF1499 family)